MNFSIDKFIEEEINTISKYFEDYDEAVKIVQQDDIMPSPAQKYISSLSTSLYAKSVEDIANTKIGSKLKRKKNFQQIMQQSFFYGANRFGNNFIA